MQNRVSDVNRFGSITEFRHINIFLSKVDTKQTLSIRHECVNGIVQDSSLPNVMVFVFMSNVKSKRTIKKRRTVFYHRITENSCEKRTFLFKCYTCFALSRSMTLITLIWFRWYSSGETWRFSCEFEKKKRPFYHKWCVLALQTFRWKLTWYTSSTATLKANCVLFSQLNYCFDAMWVQTFNTSNHR